jgi:hypothetical protein
VALSSYHDRKQLFIHRFKPMNLTIKLTNKSSICQLTNEYIDERNSDEHKLWYSSVPTNLTIYSLVTWNR